MADKSAIEWTDATWNPVVGCSIVSSGCTNCYAMKMAARIEKMAAHSMAEHVKVQTHYAGTTQPSKAGAVWTGKVAAAPEHILRQPLKWKRSRKIFVNSMGDLFHESIPDEWIDRVFAVMALCPQHTFQVLTKRAERMRDYMSRVDLDAIARMHAPSIVQKLKRSWPLSNVWLGVSCERQQEADERIPHLLQTPAAIRFVSAEPLLGPIDFSMHLGAAPNHEDLARLLNWIIVGGESGPHARVHDIQWSRDIIAQCKAASVAVFEKQLGSRPIGNAARSLNLKDRKGGDWSEWPDDLRIRQFPNPQPSSFQSTRSSSCGGERAAAGPSGGEI